MHDAYLFLPADEGGTTTTRGSSRRPSRVLGRVIHGYAVPLPLLRRAAGSGDAALVAAILKDQQREILEHDAYFVERIAGGEPDLARAIEALVMDPPLSHASTEWTAPLVYATECLCRQLGVTLAADRLAQPRPVYWHALDAALIALGVAPALRITDFVDGEPPIPLPPCAAPPRVATLRTEQLAWALPRLRGADLRRCTRPVARGLAELRDWVEHGAALDGGGLVVFIH